MGIRQGVFDGACFGTLQQTLVGATRDEFVQRIPLILRKGLLYGGGNELQDMVDEVGIVIYPNGFIGGIKINR